MARTKQKPQSDDLLDQIFGEDVNPHGGVRMPSATAQLERLEYTPTRRLQQSAIDMLKSRGIDPRAGLNSFGSAPEGYSADDLAWVGCRLEHGRVRPAGYVQQLIEDGVLHGLADES